MARITHRFAFILFSILTKKQAAVLASALLASLAPAVGFAEQKLMISGTGDSQSLLRTLADAYTENNSNIKIDIPDSVGSSGGIRLLIKGKTNLARTARPLKPDEMDGLVETVFATSPVVFVVNPSVHTVESLSSDQILGIYAGRIKNWQAIGAQNNKIYVVDRELGDSSRSILERNLKGFKETKSIGKIFYNTPEAIKAITENTFTIGYVPLSETNKADLRVLLIDGKSPGTTGYPFATDFYVVSRGPLQGTAHDFVKFLSSDLAHEIMRKQGVIPVPVNK